MTSAAAPPRARARWTGDALILARRIGLLLLGAPASLILAGWLVVANAAAHLAPAETRHALDQTLLLRAGELPARPWTPLTALLLPASPADPWVTRGALATVAVVLTLGVLAERRIGARRYLAALLVGQLGGAVGTALFAWASAPLFPDWSTQIRDASFAGPAMAVVAAHVAASASLPRLWRRRIRLTGLTAAVTMALYHGGAVTVYLLAGALVGLIVGRWSRSGSADTRPVGTLREARVLVALIVAAAAVGPLVGALLGFADGPFAILGGFIARPLPDSEAGAAIAAGCPVEYDARSCAMDLLMVDPNPGLLLLTCVPAVLLLICALGLRRGRRLAWWIVIAIQAILAALLVTTFVALLDLIGDISETPLSTVEIVATLLPVLAPVGVVTLLLLTRRLFRVASEPGELAALAGWVIAAMLAGLTAYVVGGLLVADQWSEPATLRQLVIDAPRRLVPLEYLLPATDAFPTLLPLGGAATALYSWVGVATWVPIVVAGVRAMRHAAPDGTSSARARDLLIRYGGGSLAWMGLWDGNRHWFSADGESYVPYRVIGGIAVTTGDLIGPADRLDAALREFLTFADARGWRVCFYSATADLRRRTEALGWESTQVAEEAYLSLPTLAFTGKKFQDVRTGLNHVRKSGLSTTWTTWRETSFETRLQVREISRAWVGEQALPEMGFTLGGIAELADPDVRLFLLTDADGVLQGCASWLPIHRDGRLLGWTLDFMRRRPDGFRHTMEVLIGQAALDLKEQGFEELSLSGAPLARVGEGSGAAGQDDRPSRPEGFPAAVDAILDRVGRQLEPVYGFRSLLRFKAKFAPTYRPLYLLYPDPAALPAIGTAIARAYLPDTSLGTLWKAGGSLLDAHAEAARQSEAARQAEASRATTEAPS